MANQDPHEELREGVRRICADFPDEYWRRCENDHEFPWAFYEAVAAGGWVGIAVPEAYGGGGAGITEASILLEEIAASGACLNGCSAIHLSVFGMNPVAKHGTESMKQAYLPRVATGELHVSFGVTEPDAGTDTTNIATRATKVDGGYLIRGRKIWNTKGHIADKCLLLARTTPREEVARRSHGMTLFLVDMKVPGVEVTPIPKLGRNAVASCEVSFDDVFVAEEDRLGEEGEGFNLLLDGLNPERILLAGEALGIGRASISKAVAYANERVVFGRPIGQNQGISFPLADAHMRLRAAELMVRDASARYDAGLPCGAEANAAKYLAAEAAYDAADRAVQTLGGMGYATEYDVERYWRETRLIKIAPISQEMILNYTAEHVLGLPRSY
ncbi:MAG: acyl-CoA/acyl-ACP dehydrogenase [Microthrixaceae bacterium]|nr:acyl-CoA/acyl-ACP dehydrogenase [Acidimicrobiales bacterium]MCB9404800.1 acyl-CoA/acyl-ACP dehydrogenase [Microthrixaceae bacterium]